VDSGTGFTDIPNATGSSYTTPLLQLGQSGIKYRAVVTGFGNVKTTDVATITVTDEATGPALSFACTYTSPNTINVRFNEPIATSATTLFTDDFGGTEVNAAEWTQNAVAFEVNNGGTADYTVTEAGGNVTMAGTSTASFWGGVQLTTVDSYTASPSQVLRFGVDRVSHTGTGTAYRSSIKIRDESGTNYVLFSQNVGEGGWEYNRLANLPGDTAVGNGTDIAEFDAKEDSGNHRMEITANGSTVTLYLDGVKGPEVRFPISTGIKFEIASYVRALGDTANTVFDNAKVDRITAQGTYTLNNGATVTSVELSNRPDAVVLRTSALAPGTSYTLTAAGVTDLVANTTTTQNIAVDQTPAYPVDIGTTVAAYQDSFDGASRDPRWTPRGPGGDVYNQNAADEGGRGTLLVTTANGDPNHLLFEDPSYDKNNQEMLARIKVVNAANGDLPRGGLASSVESNSQGFNLHFRDEGTLGRHIEFLDDARSWGPELDYDWENSVYYWMRFKVAPNTAPGAADLWGKIWKGDGTEPEPEDWQFSWDRSGRTGFAGITASSNGGLIELKVDYFALKSTGLPSTTLAFQYEGGAVTPQPAQISISRSGANITITWTNGGKLQSSSALGNPGSASGWTDVAGATGGVYNTTTADAPKYYRVVNTGP